MLKLEDLNVYTFAMEIANTIFSQVEKWEYFYQRTIGVQLVSAADSIAANISEGWGRYYYKENRMFCYYARGSLLETKTHLNFAKKRALFNEKAVTDIMLDLDELHRKLNAYIKSLGKTSMTNDQWPMTNDY